MKKLIAVFSAALILLSASACSKITKSNSEASSSSGTETTELVLHSDPKEAFADVTLVENDDSTNIYYLLKDGTYKESYKGSLLTGNWEVQENDGFTALVLKMDGAEASYQYMLQKNDEGNITGIYQYEGRSFTITGYSVPDNITATPYTESAAASESTAQ